MAECGCSEVFGRTNERTMAATATTMTTDDDERRTPNDERRTTNDGDDGCWFQSSLSFGVRSFVPMFQCSNAPMLQCSNGPMVRWSDGPMRSSTLHLFGRQFIHRRNAIPLFALSFERVHYRPTDRPTDLWIDSLDWFVLSLVNSAHLADLRC